MSFENVDRRTTDGRTSDTFIYYKLTYARWVGRQDSVGPAPQFFGSGGPQTGIWWTKVEGEEFTDDMKIEFEPNKM